MTHVIYLASPIDQGDAAEAKHLAQEWLLGHNCAVFDPAAGWTVPRHGKPNPALQHGNVALLRQCDGMLAILRPDVLTIGVILEIEEALNMGIPVKIYGEGLRPSWSLAYLGVTVHDSLSAAITDLLTEVS